VLFPVQPDPGFIVGLSPIVNADTYRVAFTSEDSYLTPSDGKLQFEFGVAAPAVVAAEATDLEIAAWVQPKSGNIEPTAVIDEYFALSGTWPQTRSLLLDEASAPFTSTYHLELRIVRRENGIVTRAWPSAAATLYGSEEAEQAALEEGGQPITDIRDDTGVPVGGIVTRPHINPFDPNAVPGGSGGG
jgi:hypothetical protein